MTATTEATKTLMEVRDLAVEFRVQRTVARRMAPSSPRYWKKRGPGNRMSAG